MHPSDTNVPFESQHKFLKEYSEESHSPIPSIHLTRRIRTEPPRWIILTSEEILGIVFSKVEQEDGLTRPDWGPYLSRKDQRASFHRESLLTTLATSRTF